ncbi:DUF1127 domain-containing protein [Zavarzinia compransoris]|uniref:DUF1127 domain-containing protein n=1 Tax=Zavarzinia marina TaxID=2911065 RepID=UPI001F2F7DC7|nr:DUF1127 domain-containing protein [Zavarzinia marina]MCF4165547.1 DUF1127 domain-containing protein [Zavarzinia marina]
MYNQANTTHLPAASGFHPLRRLAAVARRVWTWHAHRRAMAHLLTLDDRLLRDIGVERATVVGLYRNPAAGLAQDRDRVQRG